MKHGFKADGMDIFKIHSASTPYIVMEYCERCGKDRGTCYNVGTLEKAIRLSAIFLNHMERCSRCGEETGVVCKPAINVLQKDNLSITEKVSPLWGVVLCLFLIVGALGQYI